MRTVEVFVTNVQDVTQAEYLKSMLLKSFPHYIINFDLQDCDRILRVESDKIDPKAIIRLLTSENFQCEMLN